MSETVVHVTTLEQWKSVLDVWFKQGYKWFVYEKCEYLEDVFSGSSHYLILDDFIYQNKKNIHKSFIEYSEFMAQRKEDKEVKTYYVTQEQFNLIESVKSLSFPLTAITAPENMQKAFDNTIFSQEKELLRYIGGDETIEFKVEEPLYRLWRVDDDGDTVYMHFNLGTPSYCISSKFAFTAPLDEIKNWQTPAWEIEKVD